MLLNDSRQPKGIGIIIGQHFNYVSDGWALDQRMSLVMARVLGRQETSTSKYKSGTSKDPMGHIIYDKDSVGDLLLSNLWIQYKDTDPPDIDLFAVRPIPAWAYAWGTKVVRPNGYAPTPGPSCVVPTGPDMYCLPLSKRNDVSGLYITDTAFRKVKFDVNDEWQHFPIGYCGIKISGTLTETEGKQREMFMPTDPRLISCPDDDPKFNTRVHDVNYKAEIDPDRWAQLNTIMRVIKIPDIGTLANPNNNVINSKNSLGWVIGRSGYENLVGGLVIDYHTCNTFPTRGLPKKTSATPLLIPQVRLVPTVKNTPTTKDEIKTMMRPITRQVTVDEGVATGGNIFNPFPFFLPLIFGLQRLQSTPTVTTTTTTVEMPSDGHTTTVEGSPTSISTTTTTSPPANPYGGNVLVSLIMIAYLASLIKKQSHRDSYQQNITTSEKYEEVVKIPVTEQSVILVPQRITEAEITRKTEADIPIVRSPAKVALVNYFDGGFLDVGEAGDKHQVGVDADGNPINSAHISTLANFFLDKTKDAPLDFDSEEYDATKIQSYQNLTNAYLRYDPNATHDGAKTKGLKGLWRFVAETPFSQLQLMLQAQNNIAQGMAGMANIATNINGNLSADSMIFSQKRDFIGYDDLGRPLYTGTGEHLFRIPTKSGGEDLRVGTDVTDAEGNHHTIYGSIMPAPLSAGGLVVMSGSQLIANLNRVPNKNADISHFSVANDMFFGVASANEKGAMAMEYDWGLVNKALQFRRHYGEKKSKLIDIDSNSIRLYLGKDTAAELVHNNTKDRTYLFPDKDGTIALVDDIRNEADKVQNRIDALEKTTQGAIDSIPEPDIDFTLAVTMAVALG